MSMWGIYDPNLWNDEADEIDPYEEWCSLMNNIEKFGKPVAYCSVYCIRCDENTFEFRIDHHNTKVPRAFCEFSVDHNFKKLMNDLKTSEFFNLTQYEQLSDEPNSEKYYIPTDKIKEFCNKCSIYSGSYIFNNGVVENL